MSKAINTSSVHEPNSVFIDRVKISRNVFLSSFYFYIKIINNSRENVKLYNDIIENIVVNLSVLYCLFDIISHLCMAR